MIHSTQLHTQASGREQEYLAGWQRARAELDNFRKRLTSEQTRERTNTKKQILESLLPLADNFQAITEHLPADMKNHAWADGVVHVARQLQQLLKQHELKAIDAINQPFDPTIHEAINKVAKKGADSGQIVEVIQTGYILGDEVIRPAKVKVAA